MKSFVAFVCLLASTCLPLWGQTVYPDYWDGSLYVRMARSMPQRLLPQGDDPHALLAQLADRPALQALMQQYGLQHIQKFSTLKNDTLQRTYTVQFAQIQDVAAFIQALEALPEIELAEKRPLDKLLEITPNDPRLGSQWFLQKIEAEAAWAMSTGSSTVVVAVVDDAVRTTHEDLSSVMTTLRRDVADGDNDPNPPSRANTNTFSHGTHCAGIVGAATDNNKGIASIGFGISVMPIKATRDVTTAKVIEYGYSGVEWAANNGAHVISMSWGSTGSSATNQTFMNTVANMGVILVGAAGNENVSTQLYPAAYNNVVAVAATTTNDAKAGFSNYGNWITISAPGTDILSTVPGASGSNTTYASFQGTSMATPLVAGLIGLAMSHKPTATRSEILSCLTSSADNINARNPNYVGSLGAGRINARAMLECLGGSSTPAPTTCSGHQSLTANAGTITDGPNNYANNASCSWTIQPANGGRVQLTFSQFNTEATYDVVRVYDGSSTSATLMGTYSGTTLPAQLTSTGAAMHITFTSDASETRAGFTASYASLAAAGGGQCNGQQSLTANAGSLTDGPGNYANNANCSWLIRPANGGRVQLTFTQFETEQGWDILRIYDGATTSAPLLGTYSGTTLPSQLTSSGNAMYLAFTSDQSVNRAGFTASYTSVTTSHACSGQQTLTATSGTFSDGSGTDMYANNLDCGWLIQPAGGGQIELRFTQFETEAGWDIVRVYDGATTSAPLLGTYSGTTLPPQLTSTGGALLVRFASDYSQAAQGFTATWNTVSATCSGLRTLQNSHGALTDGPGNYAPNMDCGWLISPPGATGVQLTFTQFDLEPGYDMLKVYNGANSLAPLLGTYSGTTLPPSLTSTGGQMFVQFNSDYSVEAAGFTANYVALGVATSRTRAELPDYKLYPNPASQHLTLELQGKAQLELVNALGQRVHTQAHMHRSQIDVSQLPAGLYSLMVMRQDHAPVALKCAVQ